MKKLLLIIPFLFALNANAGTCTADSYTSSSANSVLTSTKYNSDHSTIYDRLNGNFDGGCVSDGTLEDGALNTTDFAAVLNGIQQGCKVTESDNATLSVSRCILSVNGNFIKTTSANTVTWGDNSGSSETASSTFYVYAVSGSSGTTLNLSIRSGAPNEDGYDGSGNKVLARFYNDASSDIDQYSIDQWVINEFKPQNADLGNVTLSSSGFGTHGNDQVTARREGSYLVLHGTFQAGTTTASTASVGLPVSLVVDSSRGVPSASNTGVLGYYNTTNASSNTIWDSSRSGVLFYDGSSASSLFFAAATNSSAYTKANGNSVCGSSSYIFLSARVPVLGWQD